MDVVDLCLSSDENSRPSSVLEVLNDKNDAENEPGYMSLESDDDTDRSKKTIAALSSKTSSGVFTSLEEETERFLSQINSQTDEDCSQNVLDKMISKKGGKKSKKNNGCVNGINKASLKTTKFANKEREKLLKKAEMYQKNSIKPGECMKYITVEIGSLLLDKKSVSTDIIDTFSAKNIHYKTEAPPIAPDNCIGWTRKYLNHSIDSSGEVKTTTEVKREKFILVFYEMNEIANLLISKTLNMYFKNLKESTDCQVTLLLYGTKAFFRKSANRSLINENDLDYYLTKLLFEESVCCNKIDNPADLASTIMNYTKSVAEIYYKKEKSALDDQAKFFMQGDNRECVQVDKNGNGLTQLWRKTFTKFPLISLEKAHAICEKFSSPQSFVKELQSQSPKSAQTMISEIPIRRSVGPCATMRRIGPELARKIYTYFTAIDGGELLS